MNSIELCLIDVGLTSLKNLELSSGIINLNVHCNRIQKIENLFHLTTLKHLDLSSNDISKLSGLSACSSLQTLNLACNCIQKVEGIDGLRCLKKLNVSYNQINDISGFKCVSKRTHNLTNVELYGNKLSSLKHITQSLLQSNCIKHLCLQKDGDSNPVCDIPAYRPNMLSQMPWLESLDGKDKHGKGINMIGVNNQDIPGLDEYLEFLKPSSTNSTVVNVSGEESHSDLHTPRIDTVLNNFAKKATSDSEELANSSKSLSISTSEQGKNYDTNRLESLENKLSSLMQLYIESQTEKENQRKKEEVIVCVHSFSDTFSSDEMSVEVVQPSQEQLQQQKQPIKQQQTQQKQQNVLKTSTIKKTLQRKPVATHGVKGKENLKPETLNVEGTKAKVIKTIAVKDTVRDIRSAKDDETFLSLMNEMDSERERRWKAEQASRKLLENIKILQEKLVEERRIQEAAISSSTKSKRELNIEKEARSKFEELANKLEHDNSLMKVQLDELLKADEANKRTIKGLEITTQKLEKEKMEEGLFNEKRFKELQLDAGGWNRELELMRNTVEKQKCQLSQLQELLVSREQEHKNTLDGMVSLESREVRDLVEHQITRCEAKNTEILKQNIQKLMESKKDYAALEDEFRLALQIEANRYNELHASYEHTTEELNHLKYSFEETSQKEVKSRTLLTELTSLVKEQKARITEINKCKNDMQLQYKERLNNLENEVVNLRKIGGKFESLQQDKDRMAAHLRGQESVIQGLRSERKLWGQELAQQGASLAQEKGRIDIQLETQGNEIICLQKQLKDSNDSLKIKSKLIEDQTDSIRDTKDEINKLSEEKRRLLTDSKNETETLHSELENVREHNEELQETVNSLTDRKDELKSQLASADEDLKQSKDDLINLRGQWEERSKMIDQFEEKVLKMKETFDEKENKLIKEKNIGLERVTTAEEKLKVYESKYKSALATMKHDFNLELRKIISQKDDEIQISNEKVSKVEEEMRIVLTETNNQKKHLESRISNLMKAFSDIQKDLT